jgi:hypothetical protein
MFTFLPPRATLETGLLRCTASIAASGRGSLSKFG